MYCATTFNQARQEDQTPNRVARPTQDYVGRGSHTTVPRAKSGASYADLAYGGSWCKRMTHKRLFRADIKVVVEHGYVAAVG